MVPANARETVQDSLAACHRKYNFPFIPIVIFALSVLTLLCTAVWMASFDTSSSQYLEQRYDSLSTEDSSLSHMYSEERTATVQTWELCPTTTDVKDRTGSRFYQTKLDIEGFEGRGLLLTFYEARYDRSSGEWKFLFVVDVIRADGSLRPNDNTTIDDYGYYHAWQWGMAQAMKQLRVPIWMYTEKRSSAVACEWTYTDSFYELSCPHLDHPLPLPNTPRDLFLSHSLFRPYHQFRLRVCPFRRQIATVSHCGSVLINDNYKTQIIPWIHHHMYYGIQKFYVFDRQGTYYDLLKPYIERGVVRYEHIPLRDTTLSNGTRVYNDQLVVFEKCKYLTHDHSQWILMTDIDEWITVPTSSWVYRDFKPRQEYFLEHCLAITNNTPGSSYPFIAWVVRRCPSMLSYYLRAISDHSKYNLAHTVDDDSPGVQLPPSRLPNDQPWDNPEDLEPLYNWFVPLNFHIYSEDTSFNRLSADAPMTERFLLRQEYYQHRWAFKCFSRPSLPVMLLEKWAKSYRHKRPYPPPEHDHMEADQLSYVTMHKLDHMRFDDPRARPAYEIAFAHYISFNQKRTWMLDDGGNCTVYDDTPTYPNRHLRSIADTGSALSVTLE